MRKEYYKHVDGFGSMVRVNKSLARNLFYAGFEVCIAPCKANMMFLGWSYWHTYRNNDNLNKSSGAFEELVNAHEFYNCNYELGYYSKFFVSEHAYKKYTGGEY